MLPAMTRRAWGLVAAITAVGSLAAGCAGTPTAPRTGTSTSHARSGTTTTTTTSPPSAAEDLAPYFGAVVAGDRSLKAAAAAANGAIGTSAITITQSALAAIAAADPRPADRFILAGLGPSVLLPVLTVQSDLVSRYFALHGFANYFLTQQGEAETIPIADQRVHYMLGCLGNGSEAAASFPADLAAARAAAAKAPPVAAVAPDSQAAADLAIRLFYLIMANAGCLSCGGVRVTSLAPITWHHVDPLAPGQNAWDGDIGGLLFTARYSADQGWAVQLNAC